MVEYMEWLREDITLGAGSLAEAELAMPVGRSDNIVAAIHEIQVEFRATTDTDALDAAGDDFGYYVSKKTKSTTVPALSDADVLDNAWLLVRDLGTNGQAQILFPIIHHYYPPMLVANSKLYVGGICTDAGVLHVRIGYSLRKVSRAELYDALVD